MGKKKKFLSSVKKMNHFIFSRLLVWIGLFLGILTINRLSIVTNRWWASVGFLGYGILYFSRGNISFMGK